MAEWCRNTMIVRGGSHTLEQFALALRECSFLNLLRPMPKHESLNWREWRAANWGTVSDVSASEADITVDGGEMLVKFLSPWGPPTEAIRHHCRLEDSPKIYCIFFEPVNNFAGAAEDGHIVWGTSDIESYNRENSEDTDFKIISDSIGIAEYYRVRDGIGST